MEGGDVNRSRIKGVVNPEEKTDMGLTDSLNASAGLWPGCTQRPFLQSGGKIPLSNVDKLES